MKVGFKYRDRISQYIFEDGKERMHATIWVDASTKPGKDEIIIDVYESDPDRRKELRLFLASYQILKELYSEEMFCEMSVWKKGSKESKQNMEALFELYNGANLSKE